MAVSTLKNPSPDLGHHELSKVLFGVSFVVFLVIALVAEMLSMRWRSWLPGAEGEGSLIAAVSAAVYTFMSCIP
jgi:light-harvesting complex 1 beta chain